VWQKNLNRSIVFHTAALVRLLRFIGLYGLDDGGIPENLSSVICFALFRSISFSRAVLLRALEPVCGLETYELTNSPAKLAKALNIPQRLDNIDLKSNRLYICQKNDKCFKIVATNRISTRDDGRLWRFYIMHNEHVSRK